MRKLVLITLFSVLATGTSVAATATGSQPAANTQQKAQHAPISDDMLGQFADAQQSVQTISQKAIKKLGQTQDKGAAEKIRQKANEEMVKAVKDTGLSVKDFNGIARALQADKQLRQRLSSIQKTS
ncbi:MAG: DUF4168 domain-containing protein [Vibrio sp.]